MRRDASGTSEHVTAKSSICNGMHFVNRAFEPSGIPRRLLIESQAANVLNRFDAPWSSSSDHLVADGDVLRAAVAVILPSSEDGRDDPFLITGSRFPRPFPLGWHLHLISPDTAARRVKMPA